MSKISALKYNTSITIEPVIGGFILQYPVADEGGVNINYVREVLPTQRKAIQRLKEILDTFEGAVDTAEAKVAE